MEEFAGLVRDLRVERRIPLKKMQAFAGKANHVANLLYGWRPFIDELWAAIYSRSAIESGRVWTKQVATTLAWLQLFLDGHKGSLTRSWRFHEYLHPRAPGTLYLDASGWGLGGVLVIDAKVHSYFASRLSHHDETILKAQIGSDESQQVFEALVILVAFRLWIDVLREKRLLVTLTSDNTSALAMSAKLKITASTLISRELALLLSETSFQPRVIEHLPGVMNSHADALSRLWQPGANFRIPEGLAKCKRLHPPTRDASYYSTLALTPQVG